MPTTSLREHVLALARGAEQVLPRGRLERHADQRLRVAHEQRTEQRHEREHREHGSSDGGLAVAADGIPPERDAEAVLAARRAHDAESRMRGSSHR